MLLLHLCMHYKLIYLLTSVTVFIKENLKRYYMGTSSSYTEFMWKRGILTVALRKTVRQNIGEGVRIHK